HPFREGLDLRQPLLAMARGELAAEMPDQILGRAVMIGEVPGGEPGITVGRHRLDRTRPVDRTMRARHLPHPVEDAADRKIRREREAARRGKHRGYSTGRSGFWPGSSCISNAVRRAAVPA